MGLDGMGATGDRLDQLNIGLMLASCAAAFVLPFELFLFAYAVLGPLHYLTEISWIHDKGYFVGRGGEDNAAGGRRVRTLWLALVAVTLAVMLVGLVRERLLDSPMSPVWEIGLFYLVVLAAGLLAFRIDRVLAAGLVVLAGAGLILFSGSPAYGLVAFLIITIVHVLVFTAAFLLGGALKSRSRWGFASVAVYAACIASFFVVMPAAAAGEFVRQSYQPFEALNQQLLRLLGIGSALREIYESPAGAAVMRVIAFAYTYHYLNWFTKTSVIGWNRVPRARALAIVVLWLAALAVYAWDYLLGFVVLYTLSVLHVMLELPLNHHSFAAIGRALAPQRLAPVPQPVRPVSRKAARQAQRMRRKP
jgi:hypothetical protein